MALQKKKERKILCPYRSYPNTSGGVSNVNWYRWLLYRDVLQLTHCRQGNIIQEYAGKSMKRQNVLEWFDVLVSGPDCFSRIYVSVCVRCVIFHRFMSPMCPQRTMAVLQVQYSDIIHYSKYLKSTLHSQRTANPHKVRPVGRQALKSRMKWRGRCGANLQDLRTDSLRSRSFAFTDGTARDRMLFFPQNVGCTYCTTPDYHQLEMKMGLIKPSLLFQGFPADLLTHHFQIKKK